MRTRWLKKRARQQITWWARGAPDGDGSFTYDTPVTIWGRWEVGRESVELRDGTSYDSQARVWVFRDISEEDYLYLGVATDADPSQLDEAYPVVRYKKTPTIKVDGFERRAWL